MLRCLSLPTPDNRNMVYRFPLPAVFLPALSVLLLVMLLLLGTKSAQGQYVHGARSLAMGDSGVAVPQGAWQAVLNPASIPAGARSFRLYTVRFYGLAELADMAAVVNYGMRRGGIALSLHSYGSDLYREANALGAYSRHLEGFSFGLGLQYRYVGIQDYGSAGVFLVNPGMRAELSDRVHIGATAANITRARMGRSREPVPAYMTVGLYYAMHEQLHLRADLVKDARFPFSFRGGLEMWPVEALALRTGITTRPLTYALGFGVRMERLSVNLAVQQHEWLGWSPGIDFGLDW